MKITCTGQAQTSKYIACQGFERKISCFTLVVREGVSDKRMFEQSPVGSQVRKVTYGYLGKECSCDREQDEQRL